MIGLDTRKWYELQECAIRRECWNHVIFEGDSKICIDAALDRSGSSVWAIEHLVSDIVSLVGPLYLVLLFGSIEVATMLPPRQQSSCLSPMCLGFLVRVIFPLVWQLLGGKTPPFVSMFLSQYIADYPKKKKKKKRKKKWRDINVTLTI